MASCNNALLSWIDIDFDPDRIAWVQIGQTQGAFLGNCSATDVRNFGELQDCTSDPNVLGLKYAKWDLGKPSNPDWPVYVTRTAQHTVIDPCTQALDWQWAYRTGSWTSSPVAYAYVQIASGIANGQQEIWVTDSRETIGTNRWGEDLAYHANASYGLHVYYQSLNSWYLWAPCCVSQMTTFSDPTLVRYNTATWYSFEVHD